MKIVSKILSSVKVISCEPPRTPIKPEKISEKNHVKKSRNNFKKY